MSHEDTWPIIYDFQILFRVVGYAIVAVIIILKFINNRSLFCKDHIVIII